DEENVARTEAEIDAADEPLKRPGAPRCPRVERQRDLPARSRRPVRRRLPIWRLGCRASRPGAERDRLPRLRSGTVWASPGHQPGDRHLPVRIARQNVGPQIDVSLRRRIQSARWQRQVRDRGPSSRRDHVRTLLTITSLVLLTAVAVAAGLTFTTDFESGFDGWTARSLDAVFPWSIDLSQSRAFDGTWSAEYYVENFNDAAKVWLEKPFTLTAGKTYDVTVSWKLATADDFFGSWSVIAYAGDGQA